MIGNVQANRYLRSLGARPVDSSGQTLINFICRVLWSYLCRAPFPPGLEPTAPI